MKEVERRATGQHGNIIQLFEEVWDFLSYEG